MGLKLGAISHRDAGPALVRHVYDLHLMRDLVDMDEVARLARDIAAADAEKFRNQYPAYVTDMAGETRKGNPPRR